MLPGHIIKIFSSSQRVALDCYFSSTEAPISISAAAPTRKSQALSAYSVYLDNYTFSL